jgi:hypothetical protein
MDFYYPRFTLSPSILAFHAAIQRNCAIILPTNAFSPAAITGKINPSPLRLASSAQKTQTRKERRQQPALHTPAGRVHVSLCFIGLFGMLFGRSSKLSRRQRTAK